MSIFAKFNDMFDIEGLKSDIDSIQEQNSGVKEYKEVPCGTYEVAIAKMELGETKDGTRPMLKVQFKVLQGEFKNSSIFMNQVLTQGFQFRVVNEFLNSLKTQYVATFENFDQYGDLILDVFEDSKESDYELEYTENNKGFKNFKIKNVFPKEVF